MASRLVKLIPPHHTYVESFVGGGSVFFRKPPSKKEVLNDKDKDIYHMYKDYQKVGEKVKTFRFKSSRKQFEDFLKDKTTDPVKRLFRNLYLSKNSFAANRKNYARKKQPNFSKSSEYKTRLRGVVIRNQDWKTVVKKYDSPSTFFFLDPPYESVGADWGYQPFSAAQLVPVLKKIKGKFLLTFEDSTKNRKAFKQFKTRTIRTTYTAAPTGATKKTELIVSNY